MWRRDCGRQKAVDREERVSVIKKAKSLRGLNRQGVSERVSRLSNLVSKVSIYLN
jgi:hypothetical protein